METSNTKNIILTGMRGSGKTTLGKLLSKELKMSFIDTDKEIEKSEKLTVSKIVEQFGWEYFRKIEKECIKEISNLNNSIIATGGGVVLDNENIRNLKRNGIIILIKTPTDILSKRIHNFHNRPSLTGADIIQELEQVWQERKDKYTNSADIVYAKNEEKLDKFDAKAIIKLIKDQLKSK